MNRLDSNLWWIFLAKSSFFSNICYVSYSYFVSGSWHFALWVVCYTYCTKSANGMNMGLSYTFLFLRISGLWPAKNVHDKLCCKELVKLRFNPENFLTFACLVVLGKEIFDFGEPHHYKAMGDKVNAKNCTICKKGESRNTLARSIMSLCFAIRNWAKFVVIWMQLFFIRFLFRDNHPHMQMTS